MPAFVEALESRTLMSGAALAVAANLSTPTLCAVDDNVNVPLTVAKPSQHVSFTIEGMEFACTIFSMPNAETAVRMAKMTPSHFCFMPRSSTYIGPPAIRPLSVLMRYFTESSASEYLVATPNTPVSHIYSTAPGPPAAIAVATPTTLPVPMVAANAVVSAPN